MLVVINPLGIDPSLPRAGGCQLFSADASGRPGGSSRLHGGAQGASGCDLWLRPGPFQGSGSGPSLSECGWGPSARLLSEPGGVCGHPQMGFEACSGVARSRFGMPFYGGWGLTQTMRGPSPRQGASLRLCMPLWWGFAAASTRTAPALQHRNLDGAIGLQRRPQAQRRRGVWPSVSP